MIEIKKGVVIMNYGSFHVVRGYDKHATLLKAVLSFRLIQAFDPHIEELWIL